MSKWIKLAIVSILHVAAGYLFGFLCRKTNQIFPFFLELGKELLNVFILFLVIFCIAFTTAGLMAILIKQLWIAGVSYTAASVAILLGWESYSWINISLVFIYCLAGIFFSSSVGKALKERIKFSIQPVNEKKGLITFGLILLVCGSIYLGGKDYVDLQGFEIPDTYFRIFMEPMKEQSLSQIPPELRQQEADKIEQEFEKMIRELQESKIKPVEPYIPLAIAVMMFFSLSTITSLIIFFPLLLLDIMVKLMVKLNFGKIIKETQEVERLVVE